jgi:hypothetical protein
VPETPWVNGTHDGDPRKLGWEAGVSGENVRMSNSTRREIVARLEVHKGPGHCDREQCVQHDDVDGFHRGASCVTLSVDNQDVDETEKPVEDKNSDTENQGRERVDGRPRKGKEALSNKSEPDDRDSGHC